MMPSRRRLRGFSTGLEIFSRLRLFQNPSWLAIGALPLLRAAPYVARSTPLSLRRDVRRVMAKKVNKVLTYHAPRPRHNQELPDS
jgi:hypothetical protein